MLVYRMLCDWPTRTHANTRGHTRTHANTRGHTRTHPDPHRDTRGHNRTHADTHGHTRTHTVTRGHTRTHTDTHDTHGHTRTHADTYGHMRTHTNMYGHTWTHTDTRGHARAQEHAHACAHTTYVSSIRRERDNVTDILDMVATHELQFCIGGRPVWPTYWTWIDITIWIYVPRLVKLGISSQIQCITLFLCIAGCLATYSSG